MIGLADKAGKPGKAVFEKIKEADAKYAAMYPPGSETEYKLWCKYPHDWVFPGYTRPLDEYMWLKWTAPNTYDLVPRGQQSIDMSHAEYEKYYGKKFVSPGEE
jgi:hypothetical protein